MKGDVGDLNAKDASKETVLGLLGMLVRFPNSRGWMEAEIKLNFLSVGDIDRPSTRDDALHLDRTACVGRNAFGGQLFGC